MYSVFVRVEENATFLRCHVKNLYVKFRNIHKKRKMLKDLVASVTNLNSNRNRKIIFYSNEFEGGTDYLFIFDYNLTPTTLKINYFVVEDGIFFHIEDGKPSRELYLKIIVGLSQAFKYKLQPISLANKLADGKEMVLILRPIEDLIEKYDLVNPKESEVAKS